MYFDINLKLLCGKNTQSKQSKYSGFVKLGVRWAERDISLEKWQKNMIEKWDKWNIFMRPKWDFFITYNYLCRLTFLEKEIAVTPVHVVLRSKSVGSE